MRSMIFAIDITLDGCCDHSKLNADEDVHEYFINLMQDVDLFAFGRKIFQSGVIALLLRTWALSIRRTYAAF
jgi:hypothetical protein